MMPLIEKLWRHHGLRSGSQIADVQEDAVFRILKAIDKFDPRRASSFRSYAGTKVASGFSDDMKRFSRREAHHDRQVDFETALERKAEQLNTAAKTLLLTFRELDDPAHSAEVRELRARLKEAFHCLHPQASLIWQDMCDKVPVFETAEKLGLTKGVIWDLRQAIKAVVRAVLGNDSC